LDILFALQLAIAKLRSAQLIAGQCGNLARHSVMTQEISTVRGDLDVENSIAGVQIRDGTSHACFGREDEVNPAGQRRIALLLPQTEACEVNRH